MGGCQNYGTLLGTLNIRCRSIIGIQKGTILLTTTHVNNRKLSSRSNMHGNHEPLKYVELLPLVPFASGLW